MNVLKWLNHGTTTLFVQNNIKVVKFLLMCMVEWSNHGTCITTLDLLFSVTFPFIA